MKSFALHKQLKAFTLLELLVGMILSGIVLTATFSAYHIIMRQYETYRDKSESDAEVSFFVSQLQADFANAENVLRVSENEIQLRSESRILEYGFSESRVLRNDLSRMDTFRVSVIGIETFFKSEKTNFDAVEIDELRVMMDVAGKKVEKIYLRENNAKEEMDEVERGISVENLPRFCPPSIHFCHLKFRRFAFWIIEQKHSV